MDQNIMDNMDNKCISDCNANKRLDTKHCRTWNSPNVKHAQNIGAEINGNSGPDGTVKHGMGFPSDILRQSKGAPSGSIWKLRMFF